MHKIRMLHPNSILNMYLPVDLLSRSNGYREIWTVGNEEWLAGRVSKMGVSSCLRPAQWPQSPGMAFLAASRIQVTAVATTDPRVCGSTAPDVETAVEALREQSQRASGCDLSRWCFYQVSDPVQSQQTALYYNATGHHREQRAIYGNLVLWLPRLAV